MIAQRTSRRIVLGVTEFLIVLALLAGALALTYKEVLFSGNKDLAGRFDVYRAAGPLSYYMDDRVQDGEFPFWNPLTYVGMPYAANPVSAALYPMNVARSLLNTDPTPLKTQTGWVAMMAIHLLIAGMGMYYLGRDHSLSFWASLAAALVFVFSAIWVRRVCEYHFITLVGWVPWLLLITRVAMRRPGIGGKALAGVGCSLLVGNALLSGAINIAPYFGVCIGGYAALYRLSRIAPPLRPRFGAILRTLTGDAALLGLMFVLGACIAAPLLLGGSELSSFSSRAEGSDYTLPPPVYAGTWQQLFHDLIRYPGVKWNPEDIRGAGIAALFLALAGLGHRRWRETLPVAGLFLILFDCSMGRPWPIASIVDRISPIQMVSSTRAFDFALIPFGLLAAFGIDAVTTRLTRVGGVVRDLAMVAGALCLVALWPIFSGTDYMPMSIYAIGIPLGALLVFALASRLPGAVFWRAALALFIFAETFSWSLIYVPRLVFRPNYASWSGTHDGSATLWADNQRGVDEIPNRHLYDLRGVINGYEPVHIARVREVAASERRLKRYSRMLDHDEVTQDNARGNLFLKRAFWLARQYATGPLPPRNAVFPSTTTVFLDTTETLPVPSVDPASIQGRPYSDNLSRTPVTTGNGTVAFSRIIARGQKKSSIALPVLNVPAQHTTLAVTYQSGSRGRMLANFKDEATGRSQPGAQQPIRNTSGGTAVAEFPMPDFARVRVTLTLELSPPLESVQITQAELLTDLDDETEKITIQKRKANSISVLVSDLPGPRVLSYIDAAFPGWSASLDGKDVPLYLANEAFKAVVVPAGSHEIVFTYTPAKLLLGLRIAGTTAVLSLVLMILWGLFTLLRAWRARGTVLEVHYRDDGSAYGPDSNLLPVRDAPSRPVSDPDSPFGDPEATLPLPYPMIAARPPSPLLESPFGDPTTAETVALPENVADPQSSPSNAPTDETQDGGESPPRMPLDPL